MAALNARMLGPNNVAHQRRVVFGRPYTAQAGQILTVPAGDGDALHANGWTLVAYSGPTASRPVSKLGQVSMQRGSLFWDETLGKLIVSDGTYWRDPSTGTQV